VRAGDLAAMCALSTPGRTRSLLASKQRSAGTPPSPVTPPQFESMIEARVGSQTEPQGLEQPPASRVLVKIWSAPPLALKYGYMFLT
jgi:hypothetical protein